MFHKFTPKFLLLVIIVLLQCYTINQIMWCKRSFIYRHNQKYTQLWYFNGHIVINFSINVCNFTSFITLFFSLWRLILRLKFMLHYKATCRQRDFRKCFILFDLSMKVKNNQEVFPKKTPCANLWSSSILINFTCTCWYCGCSTANLNTLLFGDISAMNDW